MSFIISNGYIPAAMLEVITTPVQKKNKDPTIPTKYIVCHRQSLRKGAQRRLWYRTSPNCSVGSPRNPHLLISEMQNESKDRHDTLSFVTLDAAKGFDIVWQVALLHKIFIEGLGDPSCVLRHKQ